MRYYENDWVLSGASGTRTTQVAEKGNTFAPVAVALLLPLLVVWLLSFVWSGSHDPRDATVLITTGGGGSGTGTLISPNGYIVTNRHIAMPNNQKSTDILVYVHSGTNRNRGYTAQLVSPQGTPSPLSDQLSKLPEDVAILKIEATEIGRAHV